MLSMTRQFAEEYIEAPFITWEMHADEMEPKGRRRIASTTWMGLKKEIGAARANEATPPPIA